MRNSLPSSDVVSQTYLKVCSSVFFHCPTLMKVTLKSSKAKLGDGYSDHMFASFSLT